jgi:hypothetical protein
MKIVISKKDISGLSGFDVGLRFDKANQCRSIFIAKGGVLIEQVKPVEPDKPSEKATKKTLDKFEARLVSFNEAVRKQQDDIADTGLLFTVDPGYVDSKLFGPPTALGVIQFDSIPDDSKTVIALRNLGVTDEALRKGIVASDPASYPLMEVSIV